MWFWMSWDLVSILSAAAIDETSLGLVSSADGRPDLLDQHGDGGEGVV